jgi:transposase
MIPLGVDIFVATEPIDLRISFDLLSGKVREQLGGDPKSGAIFVFFGKRKDKMKALFYDRAGFCIFYKRLCRGTFRIPEKLLPSDTSVALDDEELSILLAGFSIEEKVTKRVH